MARLYIAAQVAQLTRLERYLRSRAPGSTFVRVLRNRGVGMGIPIDECNVFIQVWVDASAVGPSSGSAGLYLVDNTVASGGTQEGTAGLVTACPKNTSICWQVM